MFSRSPMKVARSHALGHLLQLTSDHWKRATLEMQQPGEEAAPKQLPAPRWDASVAVALSTMHNVIP